MRFLEIQHYIDGKSAVPVSTTEPPASRAAPEKSSIDPKLTKYTKMRQDGFDEDRFQEVKTLQTLNFFKELIVDVFFFGGGVLRGLLGISFFHFF